MKQHLLTLGLLSVISAHGQQTDKVDFLTGDANIKFDISQRKVIGSVNYQMQVNQSTDSIFIDAKNMHIKQIKINDQNVQYKYNKQKIALYTGYKEGKNAVTIQYEAVPKSALYWVGNGTDLQIWTQGQGKNNSHWIPSFDDVNEKVVFSMKISFDKSYQVLSNGKMVNKSVSGNEGTWSYKMNQPMSSYLLMLAIGKYAHKIEKSNSNVPIENHYIPTDASKYNNTYEFTARMMDILEKQIGVSYPWEIYRNIPATDFMYSGMENTTSTLFNQSFVVDNIAKNDKSYVNVNAHEMAHQWFGNMITAKNIEDHWLQEGFSTYYALLVERELYGVDHFYWELYEMAEKIQKDALYNKNTKVVSEKATTTTYYDKGAWAIFYLSTQIGEENLRTVVKSFLNEYAYKNASTQDFLDHILKAVPTFNVDSFKSNWLYNPSFPVKDAIYLISNSTWVKNHLAVIELQKTPFELKKDQLLNILKDSNQGLPARREVVFQLNKISYDDAKEFYNFIAQSNDLKLRQALIQIIDTIPDGFVNQYKTFMNDDSYITREIVLKNLWFQRQSEQHQLLDSTQKWEGMPDKNLRITWLMLALKTENYNLDKKTTWYRELEYYASSTFTADVRQNAINAMWYLNPYDSNVLPQLINGLVHHNSRFAGFCRDAIKNLSVRKEFKEYFNKQVPYLPMDEHLALKKLMENL